jgi:hypothetical protein
LIGGDEEDRTPGLGIANAALSQLSYIPRDFDFKFKFEVPNFSKLINSKFSFQVFQPVFELLYARREK